VRVWVCVRRESIRPWERVEQAEYGKIEREINEFVRKTERDVRERESVRVRGEIVGVWERERERERERKR